MNTEWTFKIPSVEYNSILAINIKKNPINRMTPMEVMPLELSSKEADEYKNRDGIF